MGTTDGTNGRRSGFREAKRELKGLTSGAEKRLLARLAARTPPWVTSDHLTALGLLAMAACGALYAGSGRHPELLLAVDVALVVNWLGDSLDGTLARFRGVERPRFGFYVDHLSDALGAMLLLGGLALSGLMSPLVAAGLLGAYYLLAIESYLATYAIGRFKISWGPVGGTELRILLGLLNVVVLFRPRVSLAGGTFPLFDLVGVGAGAALLGLAIVAGVRGTRALAREEGWAPAMAGPATASGRWRAPAPRQRTSSGPPPPRP
jgi:archaetidylinositol phosphate synthase